MSDQVGSVNSQIVDSTTGLVTLLTGHAPSHSLSLLDVVMAETLGMVMYNAANRQQSSSAISSAAVTAACAKILSAQSVYIPPPPVPPSPPFVVPLPGPEPDPAPEVVVATAYTEAEIALQALMAQAASASATSQMAQADVDSLIVQAGGTPPAAPATNPVTRPQWAIRAEQAVAEARAAIDVLMDRAGDPNTGRAELDTLVAEAGGVPPPTPRAVQINAASSDPLVAEAFAAARSVVRELQALAAGGAAAQWRTARAGLDWIITHAGGMLASQPAPREP